METTSPWDRGGWKMMVGKDPELNTCTWKQINSYSRMISCAVSALMSLASAMWLTCGCRDTLLKYGYFHGKLRTIFMLMFVFDVRSMFIGWEACYTGMLFGVALLDIGECVWWPWMPVLVGDAFLFLMQLAAGHLCNVIADPKRQSGPRGAEIYEVRKEEKEAARKQRRDLAAIKGSAAERKGLKARLREKGTDRKSGK